MCGSSRFRGTMTETTCVHFPRSSGRYSTLGGRCIQHSRTKESTRTITGPRQIFRFKSTRAPASSLLIDQSPAYSTSITSCPLPFFPFPPDRDPSPPSTTGCGPFFTVTSGGGIVSGIDIGWMFAASALSVDRDLIGNFVLCR